MKAIQVHSFGEPEVLQMMDIPAPLPGPEQILVEVKGASVNYADIKARRGGYHLGKALPFIPGIDVAGIVVGVGEKVSEFKVGDRIMGFPAEGSYAELALVSRKLAFPLPDNINFLDAAASPIAAGTVTHMLTRIAQAKADDKLLVHTAAGGVGSMAVQIASALDIKNVIGSTSSPWKKEKLRTRPVKGVVDYTTSDYPSQVMDLTDGKGVDVIINTIGGPTLERDLKCLAPFGSLILCGKLSGEDGAVNPSVLHPNNRRIIGFSFGHYRKFRPELITTTMKTVIEFLESGRLKPVINRVYPLAQATEAHRLLESRQSTGKVLLIP